MFDNNLEFCCHLNDSLKEAEIIVSKAQSDGYGSHLLHRFVPSESMKSHELDYFLQMILMSKMDEIYRDTISLIKMELRKLKNGSFKELKEIFKEIEDE